MPSQKLKNMIHRPGPSLFWLFYIGVFSIVLSISAKNEVFRVACVGDSITQGARVDADTQSYPVRLAEILGDHYEIRNFGVGGATMLRSGKPTVRSKLEAIKASEHLAFEDVERFMHDHRISNEGGRSYFFSKEALVVWTKKNRWTWRDRGIRMNAVSPGPVETPILADFVKTLGARAEEDMSVNDRPGRHDDIAPVVCFLLSDMTHWFRGANLMLDGGMSSHIYQNIHQF